MSGRGDERGDRECHPALPATVRAAGRPRHRLPLGRPGSVRATAHLSAINQHAGPKPWKLTFSFGRALQDEALSAWGGWPENVVAGQHAFRHRARCDSSAALGLYVPSMEAQPAVA